MKINDSGLKQKVLDETYSFLLYAIFLSLFFCSLTTYERLVLDEYSIPFIHYGYSFLQGMIFAKIILLGEHWRIGEKWEGKSLIIPALYKTMMFSVLTLVFSIVEDFVMGFFKGTTPEKTYGELISHGIYAILAKIWIVFSVFILFFAFTEISRVLGGRKLFDLFFCRKSG